jgi:long-chain acyl-CoA synthetase
VHGAERREISLASHDALRIEGNEGIEGSDDEATIVYTSAMAGTALGAIGTHRNLLANAYATIDAAALTKRDQVLALLPFSHLFGLVVPALAPLLAGGRVHCMPRFHPIKAIERLEREPLSAVVGVPAVFAALLSVLERRGTPLDAPVLRLCICGGAPLPSALQEGWLAHTGVELREGYGLTEGGPVCLFNHIASPNALGTLGLPFPGVDVDIRDAETGRSLGVGEVGEICVRGDNVSPGYVRGSANGLSQRDGWLHTGDLGARLEGGRFAFRGVLKPMFTHNGFNVYSREVERVVAALDGVREARVVPVADAARGHTYRLVVDGAVDEATVRAWCETHLATYKQPATIEIGAR